jgi:DNA-binding NtrC family response regulator
MNKLPATQPRPENTTLLTVNSNVEDRLSLERILNPNGWTIQGANSIREATLLLKDRPSLILCEKDLPDGSWKDIFREAQLLDYSAPVVVVSRSADERLWAEVLNLGGFDLLLRPFVRNEVEGVVSMACRHAVPDAALCGV